MTPDERAGFGSFLVTDPDPTHTWTCSELFNGGATPSFDPCNPPPLRVSCPECIYEMSFQAGQGEWSTQHQHDHVCSMLLVFVAALAMLLLFVRNRSNG